MENIKRRVYFDNAATTYPKPGEVADAVYNYIKNIGSNVNRGGYSSAYEAEDVIMDTRAALVELFNGKDERNVVFTSGVTLSLNMVLQGLLKEGDHVITSSMEHNAVMRPLTQLADNGRISFDRVRCDSNGCMKASDLEKLICDKTRAVVISHASNVCGAVQPLRDIGRICRKYGLFFIVDAAQTAGVIKIDMQDMCIDALCFTGHKGLYGPQGIGGFILGERFLAPGIIDTLIAGGTGSASHLETMPDFMPDRFESGTMNIPGIYGLYEGLKFIEKIGTDSIHEKETALAGRFASGVEKIPGVRVISGGNGQGNSVGVVSLVFTAIDQARAAFLLDEEFGIQTRVGLHCAPSAHRTLGTFPEGTVRFSFGYFNTAEEVDYGIEAVRSICERC